MTHTHVVFLHHCMSLVAKANALKVELGLPRDMPAAHAIPAVACEIMQIVVEPGDSLPCLAWVLLEDVEG